MLKSTDRLTVMALLYMHATVLPYIQGHFQRNILNYYNAGPNGLKDHYPLDISIYGSAGLASRDTSKGRYKRPPSCRFFGVVLL